MTPCKFVTCVLCPPRYGAGAYARPVPEVRYDVHGTAVLYDNAGRYRGLLANEASALSDALYYDLPGSPCLLTLRKRWAERASEDDVTSVDEGLYFDYGRVSARNYNEEG